MVLPGLSPPGNALTTGPRVGDRQVRHGKQRESRSVFAGAIFSCDLPENERDLPLEIVDLPEKNCDHTEKTGDLSEKSAVQAGNFADRAEKNQDLPKNHDPSTQPSTSTQEGGKNPPKNTGSPVPDADDAVAAAVEKIMAELAGKFLPVASLKQDDGNSREFKEGGDPGYDHVFCRSQGMTWVYAIWWVVGHPTIMYVVQ